jgi:hypothetical protein
MLSYLFYLFLFYSCSTIYCRLSYVFHAFSVSSPYFLILLHIRLLLDCVLFVFLFRYRKMTKVKTSNYSRLRYFVSEFEGDEVFTIDTSTLFWKLCGCKVNSDKKFNVTQYLKTEKQLHTNDFIIQGQWHTYGRFPGSNPPRAKKKWNLFYYWWRVIYS